MTDLATTNGVHADHSPAEPVLTVRARMKAVRSLVEDLMEELVERHDGDLNTTYLAVRQADKVFGAILLGDNQVDTVHLDQYDRDLIWAAVCAARELTGADPKLDKATSATISQADGIYRPSPTPDAFNRSESPESKARKAEDAAAKAVAAAAELRAAATAAAKAAKSRGGK